MEIHACGTLAGGETPGEIGQVEDRQGDARAYVEKDPEHEQDFYYLRQVDDEIHPLVGGVRGFFERAHQAVGLIQHHHRIGGHLALGCAPRRQTRLRQHPLQRGMLVLPGFINLFQLFFQIVPGAAHQRRKVPNLACHAGVAQVKCVLSIPL